MPLLIGQRPKPNSSTSNFRRPILRRFAGTSIGTVRLVESDLDLTIQRKLANSPDTEIRRAWTDPTDTTVPITKLATIAGAGREQQTLPEYTSSRRNGAIVAPDQIISVIFVVAAGAFGSWATKRAFRKGREKRESSNEAGTRGTPGRAGWLILAGLTVSIGALLLKIG